MVQVISLRKKHPLLRRRTYPKPENTAWLSPEGHAMTAQDWELPFARCIGMLMVGERLAERDERGNPVMDDDLLVLLNAHHDAIDFALPGEGWVTVLDTAVQPAAGKATYPLQGRSLALLTRPTTAASPST